MADFATLDAIGFPKYFYYRAEVAKYRGKGLSDDELEERAADTLLDLWLSQDWTKHTQRQFCVRCKKELRDVLRVRLVRRCIESLDAHEGRDGFVLEDTTPDLSESVMNMVDAGFMEAWENVFADVFSNNAGQLCIARKHLIEGKTFQEIADELGCKTRQNVHRRMAVIYRKIRVWVAENTDKIYSYFDRPAAEVIINLSQAC